MNFNLKSKTTSKDRLKKLKEQNQYGDYEYVENSTESQANKLQLQNRKNNQNYPQYKIQNDTQINFRIDKQMEKQPKTKVNPQDLIDQIIEKNQRVNILLKLCCVKFKIIYRYKKQYFLKWKFAANLYQPNHQEGVTVSKNYILVKAMNNILKTYARYLTQCFFKWKNFTQYYKINHNLITLTLGRNEHKVGSIISKRSLTPNKSQAYPTLVHLLISLNRQDLKLLENFQYGYQEIQKIIFGRLRLAIRKIEIYSRLIQLSSTQNIQDMSKQKMVKAIKMMLKNQQGYYFTKWKFQVKYQSEYQNMGNEFFRNQIQQQNKKLLQHILNYWVKTQSNKKYKYFEFWRNQTHQSNYYQKQQNQINILKQQLELKNDRSHVDQRQDQDIFLQKEFSFQQNEQNQIIDDEQLLYVMKVKCSPKIEQFTEGVIQNIKSGTNNMELIKENIKISIYDLFVFMLDQVLYAKSTNNVQMQIIQNNLSGLISNIFQKSKKEQK